MEILQLVVNYILDLGAMVFIPIILMIIGMSCGMKPGKAFSAALTFGVAFAGVKMVQSYLTSNVGAAARAFVDNHGLSLNALDMGWAAMTSFTWQWTYAFLMFPIQLVLNIVMLALGWTKTMNVDMWQVVQKVFTAYIVSVVSGSVPLGFAFAIVQMVLELKCGDAWRKEIQIMTGVPGITIPHPHVINTVWLYPIGKLFDKILPTKRKIDANVLREKIGIFGENHVLGFIIGTLMGFFGGYSVGASLTVGVQAATALMMLPMVTKLFPQALAPISNAASSFVQKVFPGKEIVIGLDWPVLAGNPEIWVVEIICVPIILAIALVLPGNIVLPFTTLLCTTVVVPAFIAFKGDIVRMLICNIVGIPILLWTSSYLAPVVTQLAQSVGAAGDLAEGSLMAWYGCNISSLRWAACEVTQMNPLAIGVLVLYVICSVFFFKGMAKRNAEIDAANGIH